MTITNPMSGAINVSVYDNDGTYLVPNISLGPGQMLSYNGASMMNGLIWVASAPGLSGKFRLGMRVQREAQIF